MCLRLSILIYAYVRDNTPKSWFGEEKQVLCIAYHLYIRQANTYKVKLCKLVNVWECKYLEESRRVDNG